MSQKKDRFIAKRTAANSEKTKELIQDKQTAYLMTCVCMYMDSKVLLTKI